MAQAAATGEERIDATNRIESMYMAAHQAWVTAMGAWSAAHEKAVADAASDAWTMEERAWTACRSMAACRELAWKFWEDEVASSRQRAIESARGHEDLHIAIEEGVKRAIERRAPELAASEDSLEPAAEAAPAAEDAAPRPSLDFHPPAPPAFAPPTVPADFGPAREESISIFDTQPAAPRVAPVTAPALHVARGADDGGSAVVRRLQALLEDQAIVRQA